MIYKVLRKQNNSDMCFVCGISNDAGLKTSFYELDGNQLLGVFKGLDIHQSYPQRMHGGIIVALLDETIGRALSILEPDFWGVTVNLSIKFIKPVPLKQELKAVGWITNNRRLLFEGEGYLCDNEGNILATCEARYRKQPVDVIVQEENFIKEQWIYVEDDQSPLSFDLPQ
jgi:acyl-coenzyme A thioesterase PaaI-like protein